MGAPELRNKLIEQFNLYIQDDSKLVVLEGVFDAINDSDSSSSSSSSSSLVSDEHYNLVEERRLKYHAGETSGLFWDEVKQNLKL